MSDRPADEFVPPYGGLIGLVHEAALSSEAVDYYNLTNDCPAHLAAWNWLLHERISALLALVRYVQVHGDQIVEGITANLPSDVPPRAPSKLMRSMDLLKARSIFMTRYVVQAEQAAAAIDQIAEDDVLARRLAYERRPTEARELSERQVWRGGTEEWRGTMRREARRLRDALIHRLAMDAKGWSDVGS